MCLEHAFVSIMYKLQCFSCFMCCHDYYTQSVLLERTYLQAVEPAHCVQLTVSVIETDLLSVLVTLASTEHQEKRTYLVDVSLHEIHGTCTPTLYIAIEVYNYNCYDGMCTFLL